MSISFLRPPALPVLTFVRYKARPPSEKLKKPEDKSSIILGKWKPSVAFPKPGVSDKAVSIVVSRLFLNFSLREFTEPNPCQVGEACSYPDRQPSDLWGCWRPRTFRLRQDGPQ